MQRQVGWPAPCRHWVLRAVGADGWALGGRRYNRGVLKPHSKAPRGLVALGSAAILAVYGAGYTRTRTTGSRFAETPAIRRPAPPGAMANTVSVPATQPALSSPHEAA